MRTTPTHTAREGGVDKLSTAASAAPGGTDPFVALYNEKVRVLDIINISDSGRTDQETDALMDCWGAYDAAAIATPATTATGAAASIQWARDEIIETWFMGEEPTDPGGRLILALLDGALGVMRAQGGVA